MFTPSLVRMLPGLQSFTLEVEGSDMLSIVAKVKETVTEKILQLKTDWRTRADFLVPLYKDFIEGDVDTFINFQSMTELQFAF